MRNRLDVVAIGIEDEGAVVAGMIKLAYARAAIVLSPRGNSSCKKRVDLSTILCAERKMNVWVGLATARQPEERLAIRANARHRQVARDARRKLHQDRHPQRCKCSRVESLRGFKIGDAQSDVINLDAHFSP